MYKLQYIYLDSTFDMVIEENTGYSYLSCGNTIPKFQLPREIVTRTKEYTYTKHFIYDSSKIRVIEDIFSMPLIDSAKRDRVYSAPADTVIRYINAYGYDECTMLDSTERTPLCQKLIQNWRNAEYSYLCAILDEKNLREYSDSLIIRAHFSDAYSNTAVIVRVHYQGDSSQVTVKKGAFEGEKGLQLQAAATAKYKNGNGLPKFYYKTLAPTFLWAYYKQIDLENTIPSYQGKNPYSDSYFIEVKQGDKYYIFFRSLYSDEVENPFLFRDIYYEMQTFALDMLGHRLRLKVD